VQGAAQGRYRGPEEPDASQALNAGMNLGMAGFVSM
jgi:hypothetical protein